MKTILKNKFIRIILIIELIIIGYLAFNCFTSNDSYHIPYTDMSSNGGEIIEGVGIHTDNTQTESGFFTYGPFFNAKKGMYEITIDYETVGMQNYIEIGGANLGYNSVLMEDFYLDPNLNSMTFSAWLQDDIMQCGVYTIYDGTEPLTIKEITMKETTFGKIYILIKNIFFLMCVNFVIYLYIMGKEGALDKKKILRVMFISAIVIFASYPVFGTFLTEGDDLTFHLLRIEGIKDGLLSGQFPVRIHPTQFNGHGYASSIFYGEAFLYFPAVLRLLGFPLQTAYKIFLIVVNMVTAIVTYKCVDGIIKNKKVAIVATFLYVLAPYRLANIYVRAAVGEYCAMIFWPIIAYGLYKLFTVDVHSKEYKKNWIYLTIGYTGIIQTHMLSCEIAAAVSIVICLIMFKKTFRKETIIELLKFFALTLLINGYFLLPLLEFMFEGGYLITDYGSLQTKAIQGNGLYPAQLFALFVSGSGMAYGHFIDAYKVLGMSNEMGTTVGLGLLISLILFAYLNLAYYKEIKKSKLYGTGVLMFLASLLALFMSTVLFPWDALGRRFGDLVANLQFPWRMLSVATIFLTILFAVSIIMSYNVMEAKKVNSIIVVIFAINLVTSGYMLYDRLNTSKGIYVYDATSISSGSGSLNEYLPVETDAGMLVSGDYNANSNLTITYYDKYKNNVRFHALCNNGKPGQITLPLIYYKGYEAVDDNNNKITVDKDNNGIVILTIPAGFDGTISLRYAGFVHWRVAEWISFVSFIAFLYFAIKLWRKNTDTI